jgi:hypothetical protein
VHVNDTTFEKEVGKAVQPVLLDFYGDW